MVATAETDGIRAGRENAGELDVDRLVALHQPVIA